MEPEEICKYQIERIFGKRYREASLSTCQLSLSNGSRLGVWLKELNNFLLLIGPPGTGKTHLMAAIFERLFSKRIGCQRFWTESEFLGHIRRGFDKYSQYDYHRQVELCLDSYLVGIDDLGSNKPTSDWREEVIFDAIDYRYRLGWPTIFSSNLSKEDFYSTYKHSLCDRLFARENTIVDFSNEINHREE